MNTSEYSAKESAAANQNIKERHYWLNKLAGEPVKSSFPYDRKMTGKAVYEIFPFTLPEPLTARLNTVSNKVDQALHMLLTAGLTLLLNKYSHSGNDILIGTPIYKRETTGDFINTLLVLRNKVEPEMTVKQLLMAVRQSIVEGVEHQNYPMRILAEQLDLPPSKNTFPLAEVFLLLENIQDIQYIQSYNPNVVFSFQKTTTAITGSIQYNASLYEKTTMTTLAQNFIKLMEDAFSNLDNPISRIDIMAAEEKQRLLFEFNHTAAPFPKEKTIHQIFREQVEKTPNSIAVIAENNQTLTYKQLDERSTKLANYLHQEGFQPENAAAFMVKPSLDTVTGLMGILKAGGAYLPIDPALPAARIRHMLKDSCAPFLISDSQDAIEYLPKIDITVNPPATHIKAFNHLPMPDRTLIHLPSYKNKIGMASVPNCVSIQATRGCPYKCIYCHKVWSKYHVYRSAENIFNEVHHYYKQGVRNFAFIDDCFNLNMENSIHFFKLILKNGLDIRIFFPNGLRGDIMTPGYIDLMVEAGCRGINLSLETASPRLQKLLKKNLDIDKFREVMEYIASKHPEVVLEIATMHGFPTETEEEAMLTLNFIKSIKWLHFPYIHILKIYPNTEMEAFALEQGVSKEDILKSKDLAFHELPETLPFPKSFTRKYQADFMNNYFLLEERLKHVLPVQMEVLSEQALVEKYNTYLPVEIKSLEDVLEFTRVEGVSLPDRNKPVVIPQLFTTEPQPRPVIPDAKKILLLDLSRHFSSHSMLYNVSEQPIGLIYLMTYVKQQFGDTFDGRIYKSGEDFDSFKELQDLVETYQPDLIGIRSLTFYKEFFHETVSMIRQWGINCPIIAGGPYAASDYDTILKDKNISLVVMGEGEYIFEELLRKMLENGFKIPSSDVLRTINGIAFVDRSNPSAFACSAVLLDRILAARASQETEPLPMRYSQPPASDIAYIMYTSGTTGRPKGVMVENSQVLNCIWWMQDIFRLLPHHRVVQRTPLTFDPSVWEVFWPLMVGASTYILPEGPRRDAGQLIQMLVNNRDLTVMYCTATLVTAIAAFLKTNPPEGLMKLPYFLTGAEPISMETVQTIYRFLDGEFVNTYGPTEGTINNTWYHFPRNDKRSVVPIGKPVSNNRIYILGENLQLMPTGTIGEICIAGESLVRGYLNDPEKTARAFVANPYAQIQPGSGAYPIPDRIYHTGDLGRWLPDGNIEILGRKDQQLKIRGYRIEPGDIESALLKSSAVAECAVIADDGSLWHEEAVHCKSCGIHSKYPNIKINADGYCHHCLNMPQYKKEFDLYFHKLDDLKELIRSRNAEAPGDYDCLIVFNGGRGAAYALYKLVDMGFKVFALTYDNGYFSRRDIENIKMICHSLGVAHEIVSHVNTDPILKLSLEKAKTVCRGCFHISSSLAADFAFKHHIRVTIGATLSRGQIIENKLLPFLGMGITDIKDLEARIADLTGNAVNVDKNIFDLIGLEAVTNGTVRNHIYAVDFYRYCDVTNHEMISFLEERDPYWKTRKRYAIYSTNCPIKQLGDYGVIRDSGTHYYGAATSWEKRLGHITLQDLEADLNCSITDSQYQRFLQRFGIEMAVKSLQPELFIAAYIVGATPDVDIAKIRDEIAEHLPEYMIPSYFYLIDKLPLTPTGKIDRRALPDPRKGVARENYVAPEAGVQQTLAEVWSEVLGVDKIGIDDNFFQVGGDSIKAIQISARLVQRKYKLEIKDLFTNPSIRHLAGFVTPVDPAAPAAEQVPVTGDVPLTPIQHWFLETHSPRHRHHFNQAIMLYRKEGFSESIVRDLLTEIVEHHDALRIIKIKHENGDITLKNRDIEGPLFHLETIDLTSSVKTQNTLEQEIESVANRLQTSFNLETGPMLHAGLFHTQEGSHLLVIIHHLVVDGISWRIIMEDLATGYRQLEKRESVQFPVKTHSFRHWATEINKYAQTENALKELTYWNTLEESGIESLPMDFMPAAPLSNQTRKSVSIRLKRDLTQALLTEVHSAFNTEINDILLTALGLAVQRWAHIAKVAVTMEGHGREPIIPGISIDRTVGWFTSRYPVLLDMSAVQLSDQIKQVKENLRRVPNKGIGYGILRYLTRSDKKAGKALALEPAITFNYLGQFGQERSGEEQSAISMSSMPKGVSVSPYLEQHSAIDLSGMVSEGELSFDISYNDQQYAMETMKQFAKSLESALVEIITFCASKGETEMTLSDYSASDLSEEEMSDVFDELELE